MTYDWKVRENNLSKATFEDYAADQAHIYEHVDANRDVFDVFLNTVRRTSKIAETVRRQQHGRLALRLTDSLLWLLTLWTKIEGPPITARDGFFRTGFTLSEGLWMKYPDRCPVCFGGFAERPEFIAKIADLCFLNPLDNKASSHYDAFSKAVEDLGPMIREEQYGSCRCLSIAGVETRTEDAGLRDAVEASENRKKSHEYAKKLFRRSFAEYNKERRPSSLHDFEGMFKRIYGTAVTHFSLEDVANHLQEEIGEVAGALADCYTYRLTQPTEFEAKQQHAELAEEMADTISWSFSCLFKIRQAFDTLNEYRHALGGSSSADALTMSNLIWKQWAVPGLDHLHCKECMEPELCGCNWKLKILH